MAASSGPVTVAAREYSAELKMKDMAQASKNRNEVGTREDEMAFGRFAASNGGAGGASGGAAASRNDMMIVRAPFQCRSYRRARECAT